MQNWCVLPDGVMTWNILKLDTVHEKCNRLSYFSCIAVDLF